MKNINMYVYIYVHAYVYTVFEYIENKGGEGGDFTFELGKKKLLKP